MSPPATVTGPPCPPSSPPAPAMSRPKLAIEPSTLTSPPLEARSTPPPLVTRAGSAPVAVSVPALETSPPIETPPAPCTEMAAPGACRFCVTTRPGESMKMPPDEAFVPAVSTPPPSDTWPAWIASVPPERLVPTAPLRSIAGEIATPPVAVIESERPVVQSLPFPPGMKQVCSCRVGADEDVGGGDRRIAGEAHVAVEVEQAVADARPGA